MNKNKLITNIFWIIFFILTSIFFWWEYIEKNKTNIEKKENYVEIKNQINNFEVDNIKELSSVEIYYTPFLAILDDIVNKIDSAETNLYIETYIFTEKRIKEAVKRAYKRWIDVKVILEKNPYKAYNINNKFYNELKNKWINIVWSNQKNYLLNHSKFIIIDDLSIILTWNISYSTFSKNRDFLVFTKDKEINKNLKELFLNDFSWVKKDVYHENLVLSPNYSREKIYKLLDSAEKNIKIYIQYFNDNDIVDKLINLKNEKNIKIEAVIRKESENDLNTIKLIKNWIDIKILTKNSMHSKAILVDEKYLFIWSVNFSEASFDKNRELWIIIKNSNIIKKFLEQFNKDFK